MNTRRLRHALEYRAFRILTGGLRVLPEGLALRIGSALGWFAGAVLRIRRAVVDGNLALAFPGESPRWRARVARASYGHLGREAVAVFRLAGMDAAAVVARTDVAGLDDFQSAVAEGRGVVLASGHLGNWEVGGALLAARGLPVDAVTKGMANRRFGEDLYATRRRLGVGVIDFAVARREGLRSLRAGRIVAMVADQNAREQGIFVPFFGTPAATFRGPALFALRAGAPMFVGICVRAPGWPQRYEGRLERIDFVPSDDMETDVLLLTEAHTAVLERAVREAPEQYFWQHKRWKTRPPQEPPSAPPV